MAILRQPPGGGIVRRAHERLQPGESPVTESTLQTGEATHRVGGDLSILFICHISSDIPLVRFKMRPSPPVMCRDQMQDEIAFRMTANDGVADRFPQGTKFVTVAPAGAGVEGPIAAFGQWPPAAAGTRGISDRLLPAT